ncbi:MAG: thioredoxin family protein [Bacteroidota bacterium]
MKQLVFAAFLMLTVVSLAQEDDTIQLDWLTNLEEAREIAKENNQPVLVYFTGSDWCAPCKALKADFFQTGEFAQRAENMVLVEIDYPRRVDIISETQRAYNLEVIEAYNTDKSFPKLVMLNHKGKELGMLSGYSAYGKDTSHHFDFIDAHLAKFN